MGSVAALCRQLTADRRTDGELLAAFTSGDSEAAFSELIRRHGPLVWGACRRLLPNPADAEDAFQAAFLVLVRRARRLTGCAALGPWLHRVAVWTARNVRRKNARRLARHEPLPAHVTDPAAPPDPDLKADLDAALLALPSRYRESIILCHLQGFSRREAAERLGCAEGTLSAWLHRGLAKLRARLRDFEPLKLPALALAVPPALAASTAHAAVATAVAGAAVPPAVHSLVEGVLHMFWVKKATAATVALFATFALGVGMGISSRGDHSAATAGDGPALGRPAAPAASDASRKKGQEELARLSRLLALAERKREVAQQAAKLVGKNLQHAADLGDKKATAEGREALARAERDCEVAAKECERLREQIREVEAQLNVAAPKAEEKPLPPATPAAQSAAKELAVLEEQLAEAERARQVALGEALSARKKLELVKGLKADPKEVQEITEILNRYLKEAEDAADLAAKKATAFREEIVTLKARQGKPAAADPLARPWPPAANEIDEKLRELKKQLDRLEGERRKLDDSRRQADEQRAALEQEVQALVEATRALQAKRAVLDRMIEAARPGAYLELKVSASGSRVEYSLSETDADGKFIGTAVVREPAMLLKLLARTKADPAAPKEVRVVVDPSATLGSSPVWALKACDAAGYRTIKFTGHVRTGAGYAPPFQPDQKGNAIGYKRYDGAEKGPAALIVEIEEGMRR